MGFGEVSANGWLWAVVSWIHGVAAVAWVGGSIFYALVLRPVASANPQVHAAMGAIGSTYRDLVDASIIALIVSGVILMFNRLTGDTATPAYFIVLGVKLALAFWMFFTVWQLRHAGWQPKPGNGLARLSWVLGYNALVALGLVVFLLAGLLRVLFEAAL